MRPLAELLAALPEARAQHLLVLRGPAELDALAALRFGAARREDAETLRLSRHSTLHGPYAVGRSESLDLQLPVWGEVAYLARTPRERGEAPGPEGGDRDGIKRVFAAGLPVRDEGRVLEWLLDVARHLEGAVRVGEPPAVLVPDAHLTELTVYAPGWLEPEEALAVVRRHAPRAELAGGEAHEWRGPRFVDVRALGLEPLDPEVRELVHTLAEEADRAALAGPDRVDGYGILVDLDIDGEISVEALADDAPPAPVAAEPWGSGEVVSYRVTWFWEDEEEGEMERPPMEYRVARSRSAALVRRLAEALAEAARPAVTLTPSGFPLR